LFQKHYSQWAALLQEDAIDPQGRHIFVEYDAVPEQKEKQSA